jgi:hypothetical protein
MLLVRNAMLQVFLPAEGASAGAAAGAGAGASPSGTSPAPDGGAGSAPPRSKVGGTAGGRAGGWVGEWNRGQAKLKGAHMLPPGAMSS